MDMSYATIHVDGVNKRLYSEKTSLYVVISQDKLDNHVGETPQESLVDRGSHSVDV